MVMRGILLIILAGLAGILVACGSTGEQRQTLEAHSTGMSEQLSNLRATTTAQTARQLVTVQFAETRLAQATQERGLMISTLSVMGVDTSILPQAATPLPTAPAENAASVPGGQANPATPQGVPRVQVTPFTLTPNPALAVPDTGLTDVVTSTGVASNDCATGITTEFSTTTPEIYVGGVATDFADGTEVVSRWLREEELLAEYSLTFNAIEQACIWFFVDQTDFEFTPGSYQVVMEVNGVAMPALTFTIQ